MQSVSGAGSLIKKLRVKAARMLGQACGLVMLLTMIASTGTAAQPTATSGSRGPVITQGMRVDVHPGTVQAPGYKFANNGAKPDAWHAKWIWVPTGSAQKPVAALFRKQVTLDSAPRSAHFWITADVFYRLYINGKLVSRGPADIGRDYDREPHGPRWLYDCRDLKAYLHKGLNVIAAEVFTDGFVSSRVSRGKHGLLLEASIDLGTGRPFTLKTDETWRSMPDAAWQPGANWDAAREAVGWQSTGFNDSTWGPASVVESVWTPLVASEIPPLMEARYPVQMISGGQTLPITVSSDGNVTLKYDRVLAAYPTLKLNSSAGTVLRVVPGEREGNRSRVVTVKLREGVQEFEYPFIDSYSVLKLEFSQVTKPVQILDVGSIFSSMPLSYAGSFECSDPHLNRLWTTSRWLTQICMQSHHLDSPNHQEPICDPGDYLIESHANYYAFGSPWLARQDLRKFGLLLKDLNYRNFHTSYSLLWLQMLLTYYDYTGDAALLRELAPEAHALLDTFTSWRGKNGLISEAPNYMFMDWVTIAGFGCHHPPAVIGQGYMTAYYYRALHDAQRIATLMHDTSRYARYEQLRQETKTAFNRELWSADRGLYRDGRPHQTSVKPYEWLPADTDIETFSPHVNTLAVLYDLAPVELSGAIMDRVLTESPLNCEPYFMYFVLEALAHCNRFERYAPALMRRWKILEDTQTYHEMWAEGDLSHAWGSAPLIQMSSTILGVRPLDPGWNRISIRPAVSGLSWARGTVPTNHGPISVSWKVRADGKGIWIEVTVPRGTTAELYFPGTASGLHLGPGKHAGG